MQAAKTNGVKIRGNRMWSPVDFAFTFATQTDSNNTFLNKLFALEHVQGLTLQRDQTLVKQALVRHLSLYSGRV